MIRVESVFKHYSTEDWIRVEQSYSNVRYINVYKAERRAEIMHTDNTLRVIYDIDEYELKVPPLPSLED